MTNVPMATRAASEFEDACAFIPELWDFVDHEHWLDYLYGRFMGWSLGGLRTELIPVCLEDFLDWRRNGENPLREHALGDRRSEEQAEKACSSAEIPCRVSASSAPSEFVGSCATGE